MAAELSAAQMERAYAAQTYKPNDAAASLRRGNLQHGSLVPNEYAATRDEEFGAAYGEEWEGYSARSSLHGSSLMPEEEEAEEEVPKQAPVDTSVYEEAPWETAATQNEYDDKFTEEEFEDMLVRNIPPRGRLGRRKDKESIEKKLLRQRNSGYERHGADVEAPFETQENTALYMSETERFHGSAEEECRRMREEKRRKGLQKEYNLRVSRLDRESKRWEDMEREDLDEQVRVESWRRTGRQGRKNVSGVRFNVITNNVSAGTHGKVLQEKDARTLARGEFRARTLYARGNSSHNPITGEDQKPIFAPIRVYNVVSRPSSTY